MAKPWPLHRDIKMPPGVVSSPYEARYYKMAECMCKLCHLALYPPMTFAIYRSYGLDKIGPESKPMTHSESILWPCKAE